MKDWVNELNKYGKVKIPVAFFIKFDGSFGEVIPLNELTEQGIQFSLAGSQTPQKKNPLVDIKFDKKLIDRKAYQEAFDQLQFHLHRGDSYLTNLTFATPINLNLNLEQIYNNVQAKYRILYKNEWVCFSPETFVKIKNSKISTFPMKGTIDANIPNARNILLNDKKEVAEHYTVVDLLRNDLSHVAINVNVKRLMYLERLQTHKGEILQMSSEIEGKLKEGWNNHLGNIFNTLIPAGSVSGAPKDKTIEIINAVESHKREFYTGVAGIYDGESVDSCVMIRFIQNTPKGFVYKSGGGITALSNCKDEYNELNQKIYVPIY